MSADRAMVKDLLGMQAEAKRGVMAREFDALEEVLVRVEGRWPDDFLQVPEDPDERDRLVRAFARIGWGTAAPASEDGQVEDGEDGQVKGGGR